MRKVPRRRVAVSEHLVLKSLCRGGAVALLLLGLIAGISQAGIGKEQRSGLDRHVTVHSDGTTKPVDTSKDSGKDPTQDSGKDSSKDSTGGSSKDSSKDSGQDVAGKDSGKDSQDSGTDSSTK